VPAVNNLEGGTAGVTITTANAGGYGNELFDSASILGTSTATFDATHARNSLAAKLTTSAADSTIRLGWTDATLGTWAEGWLRFYMYWTANPSASIYLANHLTVVGNNGASLMLTAAGKIRIEDNNGVQQGITTTPIALNQWVRVEFHAIQSATNGTMDAWLYNNPDAPLGQHTETIHSTTGPTGGGSNYDGALMGCAQNIGSVQGPWWLDELGASREGQLGPSRQEAPAVPATFGNLPGWYFGRL